jgi:hypothetical protein
MSGKMAERAVLCAVPRGRRIALPLVGVVALGGALWTAPAWGAPAAKRADRVLVITLPHVSWPNVAAADMPNLERFLERALVANMSARAGPVGTTSRATRLGAGYVAFGAGNRAVGDDGLTDQQGAGVDERIGRDTAAEIFERRTGHRPGRGLVQLGVGQIKLFNSELLLDTKPGALGESLADAGVRRAVIANADAVDADGEPLLRRGAVSALMDSDGRVPAGRVDAGLLEEDPRSPYGLRLDQDQVVATFRDVWRSQSVVLVEVSDLARADSYTTIATEEQRAALKVDALERADRLIGALLDEVDFSRDAVLVVGPAHSAEEVALTVAAMRAPGLEPGLMRSSTARRSGFVQLLDVAPTILDLVGVDRPTSMQGRPFRLGKTGGDADERLDHLLAVDGDARFVASQSTPVAFFFVIAHAALIVGMCLWIGGRIRSVRATEALTMAALFVIAFVPATFLARMTSFADRGGGAYWLFLLVVALAIATACRVLGRRRPLDPLILELGVICAVLAGDVILDGRLELNSALGYSPQAAGRFGGFGNLAFAAFASAGLLLALLLWDRLGGWHGAAAALAVLGIVIIVDGMPVWGSDVGGVLSMVPAFLITAVLVLGWRLRARTLVLAGAAAVAAFVGFAALDLARPEDQQTHIGRFFEQIGDDGWSGFALVVERKVQTNFATITNSPWFGVVPVALLFLGWLLVTRPPKVDAIAQRFSWLRAWAIGAAALVVLGYVLNDSGIRVPALMLVIVDAALVVALVSSARDHARITSGAASSGGTA